MAQLKSTAKFQVFERISQPKHSNGHRVQYQLATGKRVSVADVLCVASGNYEVTLDDPSLLKISQDMSAFPGIRAPYDGGMKTLPSKSSSYQIEHCRAALFIKIVNGIQGKSGLSSELLQYLTNMLNQNNVPMFSSDEAAGLELVNSIYEAKEYSLSQIEASSLINSRFLLTGAASVIVAAAVNICTLIDAVSAFSAEYYGIDIESFDSSIFETNRQHRGQISAASNIRMLLEGSKRLSAGPLKPLQGTDKDHSLAFKSIPQVNGSIQEAVFGLAKTMEIEINSVEDGPNDFSKPVIFAPIPAQVVIGSVSSLLKLVVSTSQERLTAFTGFSNVIGPNQRSDDLTVATNAIESAWKALVSETNFVLQSFDDFESKDNSNLSSINVRTEDDVDEDEDNPKVGKKNMKPQTDDSKLTPEQLAKVEAKRKAKAEKAAAKKAAKDAKKQTANKSLVLGTGTTQIRSFILESTRKSKSLSDLLNPYLDGKLTDINTSKISSSTLAHYTKSLLEELDAGASRKRRPKIAKGARDFTPDQMRIREQVFAVIRRAFKRHGGVEIDTPVFELKEVLTGKYGEDSKLIYDLADQGGELLSLRYDLTVPFARFLAMNSVGNIKRYHIAKVYRRDQPQPQRGRYREFYQCDFDIAGTYTPMVPDAEAITVVTEILTELPVGKFQVKLNHRKILDAIFEISGVPSEKFRPICSAVDKLDKLPWIEVKKEMIHEKGLSEEVADRIGTFVLRASNGDDPRSLLQEFLDQKTFGDHIAANSALDDLKLLFHYLDAMGALQYVSFDLSLARGLDYYTGVIYEVVLIDGTTNVGSIAAGGRYDNLVGMFSTSNIQTPCVGISVGIERVFAIMEKRAEELKLLQKSVIQVYIASIGDGYLPYRMAIAKTLWKANIATEFSYHPNPKFKKQLDEALERYIPFMVVFGEEELSKGIVKVKNMITKTEVEIDASDIKGYSKTEDVDDNRLIKYLLSEGCEQIPVGTDLSFLR